MVVFEFDEEQERVEIHGTSEDLRELSNIIAKQAERIDDHDHLMTPSWAGDELSEKLVNKKDKLINHVAIYCWKTIPYD